MVHGMRGERAVVVALLRQLAEVHDVVVRVDELALVLLLEAVDG